MSKYFFQLPTCRLENEGVYLTQDLLGLGGPSGESASAWHGKRGSGT